MEVEVEWMDDVSMEKPILLVEQHSTVRPVLLPCHHLKEVQSMGYTLVLILHNF